MQLQLTQEQSCSSLLQVLFACQGKPGVGAAKPLCCKLTAGLASLASGSDVAAFVAATPDLPSSQMEHGDALQLLLAAS
jgi:hypothetical protein